jgi:hypothetical protein
LRFLVSDHVFKIGSAVKGDLTRIKKQFDQLGNQTSFNVIDLKEYALQQGILQRKESGSLDALAEKVLGQYLPKDDMLRKNDDWELWPLRPELLNYAAWDVLASRLIFEKATEVAPLEQVEYSSPAGTRVALLVQEGGSIAAYGKIATLQPKSLGNIRVKVPTNSRLVIDVDCVLVPSAAAILHLLPQSSSAQKTKSGAYTLEQLNAASGTTVFQVVTPVSLLTFDHRDQVCSTGLTILIVSILNLKLEFVLTGSILFFSTTTTFAFKDLLDRSHKYCVWRTIFR